jgi:cyclase
MMMQQVSEHVYVETKYLGCNIGVVLTGQGPIVIDTPALPDDTRDLKNQIRRLTKKHIAYVIYTHEHFDHVIGSAGLSKKVIAQHSAVRDIEYLRENLPAEINHFFPDLYRQYKDIFDNLNIIPPQITFVTGMKLYAGDIELQLSRVGGHSPASSLIYIPQEKVLFCGDNVDVGMPFVAPYSQFGEWIEALKTIEGMDVDKIIPGHEEMCSKEHVRRTRVLFETTRNRVQKMIKANASKEDVIKKIDLSDVIPVPISPVVKQQVQTMVGMMWEELS